MSSYGPTHRSKVVIKRKVLVTALGIWLCPVHTSIGQQAGTSASAGWPQLRVNVVSKVSRGCGSKIHPAGMQLHAEELVKGAGITVSNIYNSQLALDTDCASWRLESDSPGMRVTQCLSFLQVAAPSAGER